MSEKKRKKKKNLINIRKQSPPSLSNNKKQMRTVFTPVNVCLHHDKYRCMNNFDKMYSHNR